MPLLDNINVRVPSKREFLLKPAILSAALVCAATLSGCSTPAEPAVSAPSSGRSAAASIAQADELYAQRADVMKVRQGLIALRQAAAEHATNYEVAWRVAKYNYYLGSHTTDETEQEKAFHDGTEAGKLAVKLNTDRPEGHFWLGANYGGNAEISTLAGLAEIEDIKREMEAVLKIDESFQSGSAYMALGQVYLKAPRILGGDVGKAIEYLERGLKFGPNNALLRLRLAEAYVEAKRIPDAHRELKTLFESQPSPGYEPEHNDAVRVGRELEAKLKS
jgi:tetratricopeptide (TPR) repeat protein